ncbi:MAG: hypothetical protein EA356_11740 [Geminicoccaceae bacterium]|nr:MAG: hypothetical protein EA356_11740 [Geminicoccaceae bacterium]
MLAAILVPPALAATVVPIDITAGTVVKSRPSSDAHVEFLNENSFRFVGSDSGTGRSSDDKYVLPMPTLDASLLGGVSVTYAGQRETAKYQSHVQRRYVFDFLVSGYEYRLTSDVSYERHDLDASLGANTYDRPYCTNCGSRSFAPTVRQGGSASASFVKNGYLQSPQAITETLLDGLGLRTLVDTADPALEAAILGMIDFGSIPFEELSTTRVWAWNVPDRVVLPNDIVLPSLIAGVWTKDSMAGPAAVTVSGLQLELVPFERLMSSGFMVTPIPAPILLLGSACAGLLWLRRRRAIA